MYFHFMKNDVLFYLYFFILPILGVVGAPTIFPTQYFSQLSQLKGDKGAKTMLQQYSQQVIGLTMPEAALDVDTPDDLKFV
jgi:CTP:molybdopterin cytidylyltransferase MocA